MTLQEFETLALKQMRQFFQDWRDKMQTNPDEYPAEMPEPDWFEQLIVTLENDES